MNDIRIVRSQIGLSFESIDTITGNWVQRYSTWQEIPLKDEARSKLDTEYRRTSNRADYRKVAYAWRGVATNTVTGDSIDELLALNGAIIERGDLKYVCAIGDAFDGIELRGPFAKASDAGRYGEEEAMSDYNVVPLNPPY